MISKLLRFLLAGTIAALVVLGSAGCGLDTPEDSPRVTSASEPAAVVVTVKFRNFTLNDAVDVEFFATNSPVSDLPDGLFAPENLITASVGVAGTGIIVPLTGDSIEFPCTDSLSIGTLGGSFLDNETGEPHGTGQPRWAQEGPLSLCGSVLTFEYSESGGVFQTTLRVGN